MEQYKPPTTRLAFQSDKRYHVFLSFRGPDVRKTLVDHLYEALTQAGLIVFLDSEKMEKGEIIGLSLDSAIESSAIRIPIFSKGYADSAWCLKEAAAMLRTPGLIIPLFYDVNPADVRYPEKGSSPYCQSFLKHSNRFPREEIDEWKRALQQICSRSGWSMDITQGYEARLVKTVVNDLRKTLDRVPFEVAKHPVGTDNMKNAIIQKLNLDTVEEVVKAGIWGIGGIGKTTVAKAIYNQIYGDFDAASFVFNVRVNAENSTDLTNLQEQILKDLSKYDGEVSSTDDGKTLFKERLRRKRVFLILDDVDDVEQLNALVGNWLAPGSRVIITSKNKHILNLAGISSECIQEMTGLEINESLQLFSWHAFLRPSPNPSFEDLSKRIAEACKGHPLSLEVIGSFLYDKQDNIGYWTEALHNISHNQDIHKRLYISYSALSDDEKEIFVDIACYFIGELKTLPIVFWKSLYNKVDTALHNLSMKLLIKIDDEGVFDMHDHLRDMGRIIAEKEKKGTRLWEGSDLNTISYSIDCSRLRLNGGNSQRLKMLYRPGLCYLHLQNLSIEGMILDMLAMLPPSLIWLRLEHCSCATGMNRTIKKILTATRKTCRALSKPQHSRSGDNIRQLKIMQLKDINNLSISSLFSLPNRWLVQHLDLEERISLKILPDTIGNLSQLRHLDLGGCGSLNNLSNMIGSLSQLQHLDLKSCKSLKNLPNTIGNLSQLQHLNLGWCDGLNSLPDTIGNLSQLQFLNLGRCRSLNSLPNTIGNLSQLRHLDLGWCDRLNNLPNTIGNLTQLQQLELTGCKSLDNLPYTTGNLSQLQHLDLGANGSLKNLPDTIGTLSQMQHLDLRWCDRLNNLPDTIGTLSQLLHLDLGRCDSLNNLPDTIGNLSKLQHLGLGRCTSLNNLPDTIGNLSQLRHLDLRWCDRLNNLPDTIGNLSQLKHLDLGWCDGLNNLPNTIGNLSQLQHLDLGWCDGLNNIPNTIGNLSKLQHLYLGWCERLNNLPDTICNLSQLQHLDLRGCRSLDNPLDTIGKLSQLSQLHHLDFGEYESLNDLPGTIGSLSPLQHLYLGGCRSINNLPDTIGNLSQLRHLDLRGCGSLNNLPCTIGNLSQLEHLNLEGCVSLKDLPANVGNLSQLQHLNLEGCVSLKNLPGTVGNLSQLQHLNLEGCVSLNNLPGTVGNLSQLEHLNLAGCVRLKKLPGTVGNLSQLQHLNLEGCVCLKNLPSTICNLSQLQFFDFEMLPQQ